MQFHKISYHMDDALEMANQAFNRNEVPIGCVITDKYGVVLARTSNTKEYEQNATHHAEILAITEASKKINSWRLIDCNMYVTLEPCPMCMSAIIQSRIKNLYFGAYDPKGGAISLGFNLHQNEKLNHQTNTYGGFKNRECSKLISNFFKAKRKNYKKK